MWYGFDKKKSKIPAADPRTNHQEVKNHEQSRTHFPDCPCGRHSDRLLPQGQRRSRRDPRCHHLRHLHRPVGFQNHRRLQCKPLHHAAGRLLPVFRRHHQRLPGTDEQEVPAALRRSRHRGSHFDLPHRRRDRRHRPRLCPGPRHCRRALPPPRQIHRL